VMVVRVEDAEMDEMWSFVQSKKQQWWLWHAIDHRSGHVLAYVLALYEDAALRQLKELLAPFSVGHFYTDGWGLTCGYSTRFRHTVGKANTHSYWAQAFNVTNSD
jgi:insertion element IS1 protein InsB